VSFGVLSVGTLPPGFPSRNLYTERERCSISKTFLGMSYVAFWVPSKGALPPRSPSQSSHRARRSIYRAYFHSLSKSSVNQPPHPGSPAGSIQTESSFIYTSEYPVKEPSVRRSSRTASIERDASFPERSFLGLLVPGKRVPGSPTGPLWREVLVSTAFFYLSPRVPSEQGLLIKSHFQSPPYMSPHSIVPQRGPLWRELLRFRSQ